jgi:Large polyvalent protein associated domain 23
MPIGTDKGEYYEDGMDQRMDAWQGKRLYVSPFEQAEPGEPIKANFPVQSGKTSPTPDVDYNIQSPDTLDKNIREPGPGLDTRDQNEYFSGSVNTDTKLRIDPMAGPAEAEPLVRHKVEQPTDERRNVAQKLLGVGGDRYQLWPERAIKYAASSLNEGIDTAVNTVAQAPEAIQQGLKSAWESLKLPGDVYSGKASPYDIGRVTDLATTMVFGPSAFGKMASEGTLGSFAGVGAKTADREALSKAQSLMSAGASQDEIWKQTGWWKAPDGRWKFHISNVSSHVKPEKLEMVPTELKDDHLTLGETNFRIPEYEPPAAEATKTNTIFLGDIFHNPELYKAYPWLKDIPIYPSEPHEIAMGWGGSWNPITKSIKVSPGTLEDMRSVLVHEIQHAIQHREGFAVGSNPALYESERWDSLRYAFDDFKDEVYDKVSSIFPKDPVLGDVGLMKFYDFYNAVKNEHLLNEPVPAGPEGWTHPLSRLEWKSMNKDLHEAKSRGLYDDFKKIIKGEDLIEKHKKLSKEGYWKSKGEVEARNVQERLKPEKAKLPPWRTQDVPAEEQEWSPMDPHSLRDLASMKLPRVPRNAAEELEQLMENRRTNRLMGYDVNSPDYEYYNNRIKELQDKLKKK